MYALKPLYYTIQIRIYIHLILCVKLADIESAVKSAGHTVLTPLVSLDTPGKASVEVVILADPVGNSWTHTHTYSHICRHTRVRTHACIYTHTHMHLYAHTHRHWVMQVQRATSVLRTAMKFALLVMRLSGSSPRKTLKQIASSPRSDSYFCRVAMTD